MSLILSSLPLLLCAHHSLAGKTVQVVSYLHHLNRVLQSRGPFLIVAPLSTISHWKREIEGWTDFNVVVYHDSQGQKARQIIRQYEFWYHDAGGRSKRS